MPRYIAFLRAINVGGRNVSMAVLAEHFRALGLARVETFIASGNVIFESPETEVDDLTAQIEAHLQAGLGYPVATFLRTDAELAAIAEYQPFAVDEIAAAGALNVMFITAPLDAAQQAALNDLTTEIDRFHTHDREIYWLCRTKQSESTFSNGLLERRLKRQSTMRTINTVVRLAKKNPVG